MGSTLRIKNSDLFICSFAIRSASRFAASSGNILDAVVRNFFSSELYIDVNVAKSLSKILELAINLVQFPFELR